MATASDAASMARLVSGLAPGGRLVVVGVPPDPITVSASELVFGTRSVAGNLTGTAIENEDNLDFCVRQDIRPATETVPFGEAPKAYERMLSGEARFRVVLDLAA